MRRKQASDVIILLPPSLFSEILVSDVRSSLKYERQVHVSRFLVGKGRREGDDVKACVWWKQDFILVSSSTWVF